MESLDVRRFYCPQLVRIPGAPVRRAIDLDPQESRHATTVVRVDVGEAVELFDGHGAVAEATVASVHRDCVTVMVTQVESVPPVQPRVEVATALPKGPRVATMVQMLSQIGADALIPLRSRRGVVAADRVNRVRLQRVAIEAAKQCGRPHLLEIESAISLEEALARPCDLTLIGTVEGPVASRPPEELGAAKHVMILIGPEGGWTEDEVACGRKAGAVAWTCGPYVMRIETACAAAVSIVRYLGRENM